MDTVEGFLWGHGWQLGYYKHPPLQAWLLEAMGHIAGSSLFGNFFLTALCGTAALWAVYQLGRRMVGPERALFATLLTQACLYVTCLCTEFNPNTLSLALWALAGTYFARAVDTGRLKHWLLLALFLALGVYAKYAVGLLILSFLIYLVKEVPGRAAFKRPGLWAGMLLFLALVLPHLLWLVRDNFLPFTYAASRSETSTHAIDHLIKPVEFLIAQLMAFAPVLLVGIFGLNWRVRQPAPKRLGWLAFAPLVMITLISMVFAAKLRDMWGMPLLTFIPLWLVARTGPFEGRHRRALLAGCGVFFVLALATPFVVLNFSSSWGLKPMRGNFEGAALSRDMHAAWNKVTNNAPLKYVVGESWLAGNVALYAPDFRTRPQVVIDHDPSISPWVDAADLPHAGALELWHADKDATPYTDASGLEGVILVPYNHASRNDHSPIKWHIVLPESPPPPDKSPISSAYWVVQRP